MPDTIASSSLLNSAITALSEGHVVALPTETVYGFACDARDPQALRRLFELKGRPQNVPLPVALAEPSWAEAWQKTPDARVDRLAKRWWPGPLTIVVEAAPGVSEILSAGLGTVALRVPDQPITLEIIASLGRAVALTSANRHGEPPATSADAIRRGFPEGVAVVVDGGPSPLGVPTTLVALEAARQWRVLRAGGVSEAELRSLLG